MPFGIYEVRYLEYEYEQVERGDDTLRAIAKSRMDAMISAELGDGYLLRKRTEYELLGDKLVLRCKIRCVRDIAKRLPIEI